MTTPKTTLCITCSAIKHFSGFQWTKGQLSSPSLYPWVDTFKGLTPNNSMVCIWKCHCYHFIQLLRSNDNLSYHCWSVACTSWCYPGKIQITNVTLKKYKASEWERNPGGSGGDYIVYSAGSDRLMDILTPLPSRSQHFVITCLQPLSCY